MYVYYGHLPLPRDCPERALDSLTGTQRGLAEMEFWYRRGDFERVKQAFSALPEGDETWLSACSLASAACISTGDYPLYTAMMARLEAKKAETPLDARMLTIPSAMAAASMNASALVPEWIMEGDFALFPPEARPALAHVQVMAYVSRKNPAMVLASAKTAYAFCVRRDTFSYLDIYFLLLMACAELELNRPDQARLHATQACKLALPCGFLTPLCEYMQNLGGYIEEAVREISPSLLPALVRQQRSTWKNWMDFHNRFTREHVTTILTTQEYRVAKLIAQGCTYEETAKRMYLSLGRTKNLISAIYAKLLIQNRRELPPYIL